MIENSEFAITEGIGHEKMTVHRFFELILDAEKIPADPDELIYIGKITESDSEFRQLIDAGATAEEVGKQLVRREVLLKAGFIFNNQPLPNIEKPLLNTSVNGLNIGAKKLLTESEMSEILEWQRLHPDQYGSSEIQSNEFRQNLLSFLLTADNNLPKEVKNHHNFLRLCRDKVNKQLLGSERSNQYLADEKLKKIDDGYKKLVDLHAKYMIGDGDDFWVKEEKFINENLQDIFVWQDVDRFTPKLYELSARERSLLTVPMRKTKLNERPSPFLDSGFHFPSFMGNPDFTVIGSNGKIFRVNALVLHLTSRGLSEMGDGTRGDGDQDYTISHFINELYEKDPEKRAAQEKVENDKYIFMSNFDQEELTEQVFDRLKSLATTWASQDDAPNEAKKLLQQINVLENPDVNGVTRAIRLLRQRLNL